MQGFLTMQDVPHAGEPVGEELRLDEERAAALTAILDGIDETDTVCDAAGVDTDRLASIARS